MQRDDNRNLLREIPNSLSFSQEQMNFILGHSLRSIYQDVMKAPVPENLKILVARLEEKYRA